MLLCATPSLSTDAILARQSLRAKSVVLGSVFSVDLHVAFTAVLSTQLLSRCVMAGIRLNGCLLLIYVLSIQPPALTSQGRQQGDNLFAQLNQMMEQQKCTNLFFCSDSCKASLSFCDNSICWVSLPDSPVSASDCF